MTNPLLYAGMAAAGYLAARGRSGQRVKSAEFKYVKVTTKCVRCGGSGRYGHYGACYRCGGVGADPSIRDRQIVFASNVTEARQKAIRQEETDRLSLQREKARTRRERKRAEKVQTGVAKVEADYPGIGAALQTDHDIVQDINNRVQQYGNISPAQAALVFKLAKEVRKKGTVEERRAQERAAAADAPTGRETIQGRILKVTERVEGPGYHARTVVKLLVKSNSGYLAWGSAPRGIGEATTGDEIEFTATFTPSDDDPKFAFYKRPTKAALLKKGRAARGRRCCGDKREKELLAEIKTLKKGNVKRR
jgi:hypothetical protein